ncbi:hypothetical protein FRC20_006482 [Serendipita sp. 405]|nr:hypothetical protein FRC20_006482 [Serendipita sp. 405]
MDPPDPQQWIADAESGIIFLGTPHQGSNHAMFALIGSLIYRPFGGNYTHVLKLLSDGDVLVELDRDFKGVLSENQKKRMICFYETKGQTWSWPLGLLVTRTSAYLGQGAEAAMECTHNEMNKFFNRNERYEKFIGEVKRVYDPLVNPGANEVVKKKLYKRLSARIVDGSAYSSTNVGHCTAETCEDILIQLMSWAYDSDPRAAKVYWLTGMAGTGKTTIAYTFCERLKHEGILGASFFCSTIANDTHKMDHVFPTIANALGVHSQRVADALLEALKDTKVSDMTLNDTIVALISGPTAIEKSPFHGKTRIVVLDGFDQVEDRNRVEALFSLILGHIGGVALKFFISSRPLFDKLDGATQLLRYNLDSRPERDVRKDIMLYVRQRLGLLATRLGDEREGWPTEDQVDAVVGRATPLFIYAATVCTYVGERSNNQIKRRLQAVIDNAPVKGSTQSPTSKVDALYAQIIDAASWEFNNDIKDVLGLIIVARDHLSIQSIASLSFPRDRTDGESRVSDAVSTLRSVLSVPSDQDEGIKVIHSSFPDFLTDRDRSKEHYYKRSQCHRKAATNCLHLMEALLDRDGTWGLQDLDASLVDVQNRADISSGLAYACIHWISHVIEVYHLEAASAMELESDILSFFNIRVIRWLAHMSVLGKVDLAAESLRKLELENMAPIKVCRASMEARRLTSASLDVLYDRPLRIYYSALMKLPKKSEIAKELRKDWNWEVRSGLPEFWERYEGVLQVDGEVKSVIFSNDGRMIAACTYREIRVWGIEGLKELCRLRPSGGVSCIALSSDGKSVVAGLGKGGIQMWEVETKNERMLDVGIPGEITCIGFVGNDQEIIYGAQMSIGRYSLKSSQRLTDVKMRLTGECLSFSRDGRKALWDRRMGLWKTAACINAETGKVITMLEFSRNRVLSAALSRDGKKVASILYDYTIRIYNVQSGIEEAKLIGHQDTVTSVAFSGDNRQIVSCSNDNTVRIWRVSDGKEGEMRLEGHSTISVAYSDDGRRVVSGGRDGKVRIWSVEPGLEERQPSVNQRSVTCLALSSDGQRVFYAHKYGRRIRIRNVGNGIEERPLIVGRDHTNTIAISNSGNRLATAVGNELLVYDTTERSIFKTRRAHDDLILSVAFSPDGQKVATGSFNKTIRIWNVVKRRSHWMIRLEPHLEPQPEPKLELMLKLELKGHGDGVWSLAFSPDGLKLVSGSSDNTIRIWNLQTRSHMITLEGHTHTVLSVTFSLDNQKVVSGSHDKTVRVWNFKKGEEEQKQIYNSSVWSVAFSSNSSKIACGCSDGTIHVWDLEGGEVTILQGHADAVLSVAFSPDNRKVVSGSHDTTVRLWDLEAGREERRIAGHTESVLVVTFRGGDYVLSASYDNTYRTWSVQTGKQRAIQDVFDGGVRSIALSSDNRSVVVRLEDSTIRILDVETGDEKILKGHTDAVKSVAFSCNNEKILSVSSGKIARIWNLETRKEEARLFLNDSLEAATFSPNPKIVALLASDRTLWFWNIETGKREKKSQLPNLYTSITFISDTRLVVRSRNAIRIWNVETGREDENVPGTANLPILARDGWIYSPSNPNMRCWLPYEDISTMVSNASCIVFGVDLGDVVIVRLIQRT